MNFRLPYQYDITASDIPDAKIDVKVVPDDTLTPRDIITKFSKGINDPRVKDLGEGSYITDETGLNKSRESQDEKLLSVILPDPSLDYSEFEEFSKKSAEQVTRIIGEAKAKAKAKAAPPVPAGPPAPPAPPVPGTPPSAPPAE